MELTDAIILAAKAHAGQVYRGFNGRADEPYILHPLRVMLAVPPGGRVVAVLHDVLEDTDVIIDPHQLLPEEETALLLLTRNKEKTTYVDYIDRISNTDGQGAAIAKVVKRADLLDNLKHAPPGRLRDRYERALKALNVHF